MSIIRAFVSTVSIGAVVVLGSLLAAPFGEAATYYAAKTGSDSNSCIQAQSVATPKLTIAGGLACLAAGDTLIIKAGTYLEGIDEKQIVSGRSSSAWTTIQAAPHETVILRPFRGVGASGNVMYVNRKANVKIEGLVLDGGFVSGQGIYVNTGSNNIVMQNLEVKGAPGNCIAIQGGTNSTQVVNSKIHDCGADRLDHGIYLTGSNNLVEGNEIYNISGHGIHLWSKFSPENNNNVIRYNYIHDNGSRGILIGSGKSNVAHDNTVRNNGTKTREGGIAIGNKGPTDNHVYNNTIYANAGACVRILRGSRSSKVYNNTCWQNSNDTVTDDGSASIVGNTLVQYPFVGPDGAFLSPR
jgi:hypothetical protein